MTKPLRSGSRYSQEFGESLIEAVQMLNKMRGKHGRAGTQTTDVVLNQSEGYTQMVWLPVENGQAKFSKLSVQIGTTADSLFQSENCARKTPSDLMQSVFADMAQGLIEKYQMNNSPINSQHENNNANTAKADTKE